MNLVWLSNISMHTDVLLSLMQFSWWSANLLCTWALNTSSISMIKPLMWVWFHIILWIQSLFVGFWFSKQNCTEWEKEQNIQSRGTI